MPASGFVRIINVVFKALNLDTLDEIILLQPRWQKDLELLRRLDREDVLVCPGCRQPVRIRAGYFRRWHFAHKHLENCPYARQSPELLRSRALIYDWLVKQWGEAVVTVEKVMPALPRPIDVCVMVQGHEFIYWIHDVRLSPAIRQSLIENLEISPRTVQYIFNTNFLRQDDQQPNWIHLTTTERDFMRQSIIDSTAEAAGEAPGKTLHYLDNEQENIISFRRLVLQHPPQRFSGRRKSCELSHATTLPQTGEIIHPDEMSLIQKLQHRAEAARSRLERQEVFLKSLYGQPQEKEDPSGMIESQKPAFYREGPAEINYAQPFRRIGRCSHCGKETGDWVTYDGKTGECVCRDCQSNMNRA